MDNREKLATWGTKTENEDNQTSTKTGNMGYINRERRQPNKHKNWQHGVHKQRTKTTKLAQKLATWGT